MVASHDWAKTDCGCKCVGPAYLCPGAAAEGDGFCFKWDSLQSFHPFINAHREGVHYFADPNGIVLYECFAANYMGDVNKDCACRYLFFLLIFCRCPKGKSCGTFGLVPSGKLEACVR